MKEALEASMPKELEGIRGAGTYKEERIITTPQRARIDTTKAQQRGEHVRQQLPGPVRQPGS